MSGIIPAIALALVVNAAQSSPLLMGKAQWCDRIAPIRGNMSPGMPFHPDQLSMSSCKNFWFKVPAWFAGTWHKQSETIKSTMQPVSGKVVPVSHTVEVSGYEKLGWQRDRQGGVWEYDCNYMQHTVSGQQATYHFVERCDLVASDDRELTFEIQSLDVRVNRQTNQIATVQRSISSEKCSLSDDNHMRVDAVRRAFNADGELVSEIHSTTVKSRTADFSPVDEFNKRDMRALFRRYLMSIGRLDLVPSNGSPITGSAQ